MPQQQVGKMSLLLSHNDRRRPQCSVRENVQVRERAQTILVCRQPAGLIHEQEYRKAFLSLEVLI